MYSGRNAVKDLACARGHLCRLSRDQGYTVGFYIGLAQVVYQGGVAPFHG